MWRDTSERPDVSLGALTPGQKAQQASSGQLIHVSPREQAWPQARWPLPPQLSPFLTWRRGSLAYLVVLKGWSPHQQRGHHLRTCEKCRLLGPTLDLPNWKLWRRGPATRVLQSLWVITTLTFENHWTKTLFSLKLKVKHMNHLLGPTRAFWRSVLPGPYQLCSRCLLQPLPSWGRGRVGKGPLEEASKVLPSPFSTSIPSVPLKSRSHSKRCSLDLSVLHRSRVSGGKAAVTAFPKITSIFMQYPKGLTLPPSSAWVCKSRLYWLTNNSQTSGVYNHQGLLPPLLPVSCESMGAGNSADQCDPQCGTQAGPDWSRTCKCGRGKSVATRSLAHQASVRDTHHFPSCVIGQNS